MDKKIGKRSSDTSGPRRVSARPAENPRVLKHHMTSQPSPPPAIEQVERRKATEREAGREKTRVNGEAGGGGGEMSPCCSNRLFITVTETEETGANNTWGPCRSEPLPEPKCQHRGKHGGRETKGKPRRTKETPWISQNTHTHTRANKKNAWNENSWKCHGLWLSIIIFIKLYNCNYKCTES